MKISLHPKREGSIFWHKINITKFLILSNYSIFDKNFITYIVILYNHNSFIEIKNLRRSCTLTKINEKQRNNNPLYCNTNVTLISKFS